MTKDGWIETENGYEKRTTYTCKHWDKENERCSINMFSGECTKNDVKYCFKNHHEFFKKEEISE